MSCYYSYILSWCITPLIVDVFVSNVMRHAIVCRNWPQHGGHLCDRGYNLQHLGRVEHVLPVQLLLVVPGVDVVSKLVEHGLLHNHRGQQQHQGQCHYWRGWCYRGLQRV